MELAAYKSMFAAAVFAMGGEFEVTPKKIEETPDQLVRHPTATGVTFTTRNAPTEVQ